MDKAKLAGIKLGNIVDFTLKEEETSSKPSYRLEYKKVKATITYTIASFE